MHKRPGTKIPGCSSRRIRDELEAIFALESQRRTAVNAAWPIIGLGGIAFAFAAFSLIAGALAGPKIYNRAKLSAYESGIEPTPQPIGGGRFPIKYYLTAMLFIVFDIEIVFLYPWAVSFDQLGIFGVVEMLLFIGTVFIAYAYVWRRGGLEWE